MKVSLTIVVLTYNHERFIKKTIDGIKRQKLSYSYEVLIFDDASEDATQSIIQESIEHNSDSPYFQCFYSQKNIGVFNQLLKVIPEVSGKYVAILDGDDEWIEPLKLQRQLDFLESHPEYAGSFHDARINQIDGEVNGYFQGYRFYSQFNLYKSDFFPWDVLERQIVPTSSMVFRARKFPKVDELKRYTHVQYSLIWLLQLLIIRYEKFRYFNEVWSVYNNHGGSVTKKNPKSAFIKTNIRILKTLLTDEYYRNITHHLYEALMKEYQNLFFSEDNTLKRTDMIKLIARFFYYGQLYLLKRAKSLRKHLKD